MNTQVNCPTCGKRSWGCKCNPRPKINDYSKLEGNRGPETLKGPVHPYFGVVMNEDGTPADPRNYAGVMNAAKGEPNALRIWSHKGT